MLSNVSGCYVLAAASYVFGVFMVIWFMRREKQATWTRSIIAGILFPVTAVIALLYVGERH